MVQIRKSHKSQLKSSAMDAENLSESAMTTGSPSPQSSTSTTVDSGKIRATSSSAKLMPKPKKNERYYEGMLRMMRELNQPQSEEKISHSSSDLVHKPSHYNQAGIECIEAIRAALGPEGFRAYCQGNSMKYLWRHKYKNGLQDLEKCRVYLDWLIDGYED